MNKYIVVWALLIMGTPPLLWAMDGAQWKALSPDSQKAYVMGVVDDWVHTIQMAERSIDVSKEKRLGLDAYSVTEELLSKLVKCVTDQEMRYSQIIAIADKYLNDHPVEWTFDMSSHVFVAMAEVCQFPKEIKK